MSLVVEIVQLDQRAKLPTYAHGPEEDAGMDLYALEDTVIDSDGYTRCRTGIAIAIPPGYHGHIRPRSGLALSYGITCHQGTIDAGYRGEIIVGLISVRNLADLLSSTRLQAGERIAQLVIQKHEQVEWQVRTPEYWNNAINRTNRGEKGFGSTGRT